MAASATTKQKSEAPVLVPTLPTMPLHEKDAENGSSATERTTSPAALASKSPKFWSVFLLLCLLGLSTALGDTIVTTANPTRIETIDMGKKDIWMGNSFLLASAVVQPLIGQVADVFGRKWPLVLLTVCFILGSGIVGGANGAVMFVAGRTVQGLGHGGILVLCDVVVSDLVPLSERAMFMGLVRIIGALGSSAGPIVGDAITKINWRWCFYLNLITGGITLVYLLLFLDVKRVDLTWKQSLAGLDFVGATIFMTSMTSILLGLVMGGIVFPWGSINIIVPLGSGFLGWIVFHWYESTKFCQNPMVPSRLFANRTALAGYFMAFDGALLLYWVLWSLPVYLQGARHGSPLQSGVNQLPFNMILVPSGALAGAVLSKTGEYRLHHFGGFGMASLGIGLLTLLDARSSQAEWICFQIIAAIGLGMILVTVLPAIQAALTDGDVAKATATYAFVRSFGGILGVIIPSIIFNGRVNKLLYRISDMRLREQLSDGYAYSFVLRDGLNFGGATVIGMQETQIVFSDALKTAWQVGIAFVMVGFFAAIAVKRFDMSREFNTQFGLQ
ncbi:major facilitator superfamily domain-containing protein, partial [Phaeosphaeria sp. MPI-PUGE-AT-0046c]